VDGTTRRLRLLIVDDSPFMRRVLRLLLEESGRFEIIAEARDGREGLERARRLRPDVILLDRNMPRLDGGEMLRRLRRESDVPVVMVSALPREAEGSHEDGLFRGVDHVVKEFSNTPLDLTGFARELEKSILRCWKASRSPA
jgi:two-component system chemotaxis response regulator CheB